MDNRVFAVAGKTLVGWASRQFWADKMSTPQENYIATFEQKIVGWVEALRNPTFIRVLGYSTTDTNLNSVCGTSIYSRGHGNANAPTISRILFSNWYDKFHRSHAEHGR